MKTSILKTTITLTVVAMLAPVSCGKNSGNHGSGGDDPQTVEETPKQAAPELPSQAPDPAPLESAKAEVPPVKIDTLTFVETEVDLEGDFRIQKVMQDGAGNFYTAVSSEVKTADGKINAAYAILKFSGSGEELWRFPTKENSLMSGSTNEKMGSYLIGSLADMFVTSQGQLLLTGIREQGVNFSEGSEYPNFKKVEWTAGKIGPEGVLEYLGNVAFVTQIDGQGSEADSPKISRNTRLAVPIWWRPIAIKAENNQSILIEASTFGDSSGVAQQVFRLESSLSKIIASACYIAPTMNASKGPNNLISVASGSPEPLVKLLDSAVVAAYEAPVGTAREAFVTALTSHQNKNKGRCWDFVNSIVMKDTSENTSVVKPKILVADEQPSFKIDSILDLLDQKKQFEEYDSNFSSLLYWSPSSDSLMLPLSQKFGASQSKAFVKGSELVFLGLSDQNLFGSSQLQISNLRTVDSKSWSVNLRASSERFPASFSYAEFSDQSFAAWLDVHQNGETNANNRSLHLVNLSEASKDKEPTAVAFEVPEALGQETFSSVKIVPAQNNQLVVFATVGTKTEVNATQNAGMQQASLIIGFTK